MKLAKTKFMRQKKTPTLIIINSAWFFCPFIWTLLSNSNKLCLSSDFVLVFVFVHWRHQVMRVLHTRQFFQCQNCKSQLKIDALTKRFRLHFVFGANNKLSFTKCVFLLTWYLYRFFCLFAYEWPICCGVNSIVSMWNQKCVFMDRMVYICVQCSAVSCC